MAKSNAERQREYMARLRAASGAVPLPVDTEVVGLDPAALRLLVDQLWTERKLNTAGKLAILEWIAARS